MTKIFKPFRNNVKKEKIDETSFLNDQNAITLKAADFESKTRTIQFNRTAHQALGCDENSRVGFDVMNVAEEGDALIMPFIVITDEERFAKDGTTVLHHNTLKTHNKALYDRLIEAYELDNTVDNQLVLEDPYGDGEGNLYYPLKAVQERADISQGPEPLIEAAKEELSQVPVDVQ